MKPSESHVDTLPRQLVQQHFDAPFHPTSLVAHTQGGFSGATLWRLNTPVGELCLRRWPPQHPPPQRLAFIHGVIHHASRNGFARLALPIMSRNGTSFVPHAGALWELAPWLPGEAKSARTVTQENITAAVAALAQFHCAAASHESVIARSASCPAVEQRWKAIERFDSWADALQVKFTHNPTNIAVSDSCRKILICFLQRRKQLRTELLALRGNEVILLPCLRDIWSDHVLFQADAVTGLIDYGALAVDTPATDLARLLGSYADNRGQWWHTGLQAYREQRPFSQVESQLAAVLDLSGAILSGMNWLDWLYLEQRTFTDLPAVHARIDLLAERLADLPAAARDHWLWEH